MTLSPGILKRDLAFQLDPTRFFIDPEIYILKKPVDFRKGINGLLKIINDQYDMNPCDGAIYIFTSRAKDRIKCVYYDGTGSWLFYKILNSGRFDWYIEGQDLISVTPEQLGWLLQ